MPSSLTLAKLPAPLPCAECDQHSAICMAKPEGLPAKPLCEECLLLWSDLFVSLESFRDLIDPRPG